MSTEIKALGIEIDRVKNLLRNAGIQDEIIINTVAGIIDTNNRMIHAQVEDMINEAIIKRVRK
ncbi:hypothetical protein MKY85_19935 [Paenibacillus sp. FSL R5-0749]|uniref:hypothetical protein n=1 Tax=Paenibacillus sp. FSL R5-0749 TaxID=2921657 RepID=UPI00315A9D21